MKINTLTRFAGKLEQRRVFMNARCIIRKNYFQSSPSNYEVSIRVPKTIEETITKFYKTFTEALISIGK